MMAADPLAMSAGIETPSVLTSFLSYAPSVDPTVEGELLNDMAHVALDLATLFGPSKIMLQCSLVLGRVFAMGADYLPDHFMLPEELVFQVFMLSLSWIGLVKTAAPMAIAALASNIDTRDGKTFSRLFQPAGTTWSQYKAMSVVALDWVEARPHELITTDETKTDGYIYWLYKGDAEVHSKGSFLYNVERKVNTKLEDVGLGLFGESRLLEKKDSEPERKYPHTTVYAGQQGATLLRIDVEALTRLMSFDQDLAQSIRNVVFQGMQDKLLAHYES